MQIANIQKGDTIIEVMVAFTVFALVAVGSISVMNQGTAGAQNTLETTLVRQQVDNQAELIRFMHQAYISDPTAPDASVSGTFRQLVMKARADNLSEPSEFGASCTQSLPVTNNSGRFAFNNNGVKIEGTNIKPVTNSTSAAPYAQLSEDGTATYGLWVEPIISNNSGTGVDQFIDFHVRACWQSASSGPERTMGTIVRLYVPENVATGTGGAGSVTINAASAEPSDPAPAVPISPTGPIGPLGGGVKNGVIIGEATR